MSIDYADWGDVAPEQSGGSSGGGSGKNSYLKLTSGGTYVVRPVHKPVEFYKFFHKKDNKLRTAVVRDEEVIKQTMAENSELGKPSHRYAIYVIDRSDGELKIMEAPVTVFRPFRIRFDATGQTPGGSSGGDWEIKVTGSGMKTRYTSKYLKDTSFSQEEKSSIKTMLEDEDKLLTSIYKSHDPEDIDKRLFGEWGSDDGEEAVSASSGSSGKDEDMDW
tara:strand:+ start:47728 stop:48384 length:657 start_codon:yes stop_codon:yes gene_type:complete